MAYSNLDTVYNEAEGRRVERTLYDNSKRYRFTNIDNEDYVGRWNSKIFVTVPPGKSVTLPEAQAITFAKDLCTRVMFKEEKEKFVPNMQAQTWEESQKTRVGIPMAREPYEKRILQEIEMGEETPEIQALRSEMREELMRDLTAQVSTEPPKAPSSRKELKVVKDARSNREGHEFEGVKDLK